jgi:hypothetical protein
VGMTTNSPKGGTMGRVKRFLARYSIVLGATVVGPRFYGFARPRWGIGLFKEPKKLGEEGHRGRS